MTMSVKDSTELCQKTKFTRDETNASDDQPSKKRKDDDPKPSDNIQVEKDKRVSFKLNLSEKL